MSKQGIKISVVIPVYNMQKYLEECIYSVQNQTMKELEILCVDDGSTDGSLCILRKLQQMDSRICIFEQTNQGAGAARNRALKNARGEFICFIDADDYWMDERALERLYRSAVMQGVNICGGQYYTNKNGQIEAVNVYGNLCNDLQDEKLIRYTDYQYDYNYTNYIYRRKMLMENHILFPEYRRFEDPPFFVRAMSAAFVFCVVNIPFYCYRIGNKELHYTESIITDQMQGMIDNLLFSSQEKLKRLHRLTYYRILESCNRSFLDFVQDGNTVLLQQLKKANDVIRWEWLKEVCKVKEQMLRPISDMLELHNGTCLEKWPFPVGELDNGHRIALYGAGDVGRSYFRQIQRDKGLHLCAWADKNYENIADGNYKLISPQELVTVDCDYIVIGVAEIVTAMEIMDNLAELGIPADKIVWDIGR